MTNVAVFDMNETTLDLAPVRATVNRLLANPVGFTIWFQKLLQLAMTSVATDEYQNFSVLAPSALASVAESQAVVLGDDAWQQVADAMANVEPFPDVIDGLTTLRASGWTTMALTNSSAPSVNGQVDRTGLRPLFDHVISVDEIGVYKPSARVYQHATTVTGAPASSMWMVASHDWDLAGARATGMHTAFIQRPHMAYALSFPAADVNVTDFVALAEALADFDGS
jgi:2-haloacid dehalogenase